MLWRPYVSPSTGRQTFRLLKCPGNRLAKGCHNFIKSTVIRELSEGFSLRSDPILSKSGLPPGELLCEAVRHETHLFWKSAAYSSGEDAHPRIRAIRMTDDATLKFRPELYAGPRTEIVPTAATPSFREESESEKWAILAIKMNTSPSSSSCSPFVRFVFLISLSVPRLHQISMHSVFFSKSPTHNKSRLTMGSVATFRYVTHHAGTATRTR